MATLIERLETIERRYQELEELIAQPEVASDLARLQAIAKERASLQGLADKFRAYKGTLKAMEDTQALIREEKDEELTLLAKEELDSLNGKLRELERELTLALLPKDPNDEKDVIMEVRAGTGGGEAALFAGDLFRMYSRYAETKGWKIDLIDENPTGIGGFKEIIFEVKGKGAYSRLKLESGVHRVQRVPETEASGRIHTSTSTVAVLPEMEEVEVDIDPDELRIDIFHASGHGGQNVQKVSTAVRVTHVPTGIVAVCQDERSQLKNKTKAMAVLRARLYDLKRREQEQVVVETRRSQVGSGERSEKVRTYNFPQDRVTDHRINLSLHNLPRFIAGDLDPLINALLEEEQARKLAEAVA